MAINPISGAGPAAIGPTGGADKAGGERFGKVMKGAASPAAGEVGPVAVQHPPAHQASAAAHAKPGTARVQGARVVEGSDKVRSAARVLDQVTAAQKRMDHILKVAESGKSFTPAELLSLQAHVYRASQELDLAGKVVEKATGGVKQVLQTQV